MLRRTTALLSALCLAPLALAQPSEPAPTVDDAFRAATIDHLAEALDQHYVSRDTAAHVINELRAKNESGAYDDCASPMALAEALSRDLMELANDRHLRMRYAPGPAPSEVTNEGPTPEQIERFTTQMRRNNYAFERVEILEGNVGYLKFDAFMDLNDEAYHAASSAMGFLANADAVIFDLRQNGGGSPRMVQFLCSYLFSDEEPVHLNSLYSRETDSLNQFWTLPHVPGKRLDDIPVFVLTSSRTFSGAEEFCFNLQTRDRATIVGETTGGGANPGGTRRIDTHFAAFIPSGRAVNPVTNTNWERVGVKPDVECAADKALDTAHNLAVAALREHASDPEETRALEWVSATLSAKANPITLDAATLAKLTGQFGERRTWFENGALRYQRLDTPERTLTPLTKDLFAMEGVPYARVRFETDATGAATTLTVVYDNGQEDTSPRSN